MLYWVEERDSNREREREREREGEEKQTDRERDKADGRLEELHYASKSG